MTQRDGVNRRAAAAWLGAAGAAGFGLMGTPARAQQPAAVDTLKILTGSPAGSTTDFLCRKLAETLRPGYAGNVIVDNRTGASGTLAVAAVKAAPPDGATLLMTPSPHISIFPLTYKKLAYNPDTDFIPVATLADIEDAFAVGPMVPAGVQSMKDYYAWCKANPDKASFGSPALGSTPHFGGVMGARVAGVELQHVAYRGPTPAVMEMVGGQLSAASSALGDFLQFAAAGKCRILATSGPKRNRFSPNVPTFAEQGFKDLVWTNWYGVFLPAATPMAYAQKLSAQLKAILAQPATAAAIDDRALEPRWTGMAEFAARIQADRAQWAPVVKQLNFSIDS